MTDAASRDITGIVPTLSEPLSVFHNTGSFDVVIVCSNGQKVVVPAGSICVGFRNPECATEVGAGT